MERLCFEFTLVPDSDGKSNVCSITSITTCDNIIAMPEELHQKVIMETVAFRKARNSLKKKVTN